MRRIAFMVMGSTLLAIWLAGCTPARHAMPEPDAELSYAAWIKQLRDALTAKGDPVSWLAAGLLSQTPLAERLQPNADALEMFQRAAEGDPRNAPIATLYAATCFRVTACNAPAAATTLLALDPENAIGYLPLLATAQDTPDERAVDVALARLAAAERFDTYLNPLIVTAADALAGTGVLGTPFKGENADSSTWIFLAMGGLAGQNIVVFSGVPTACRGAVSTSPRHQSCTTIYRKMMQSDTLVIQALGSSLLGRLAAPGSPDHQTAREWRRMLDWHSHQIGPAMAVKNAGKLARASEQAIRAHAREADSMRAILEALQLAPDPPAEWTKPGRTQ